MIRRRNSLIRERLMKSAVSNNYIEDVRILLEEEKYSKEFLSSMLTIAATKGYTRIAKMLINSGTDVTLDMINVAKVSRNSTTAHILLNAFKK